mmetsp:Transcript_38055/g.57354  ORF Transcript_38055/g.57354 Transcript_38055/m.57354 type:complete len:116 (+) Transcript_38055:401-748(+)
MFSLGLLCTVSVVVCWHRASSQQVGSCQGKALAPGAIAGHALDACIVGLACLCVQSLTSDHDAASMLSKSVCSWPWRHSHKNSLAKPFTDFEETKKRALSASSFGIFGRVGPTLI